MNDSYDVVIIGGGFYGTVLALFLSDFFDSICIIEKEDQLLQRASYVNQARVHNGYHYPRSIITALRSRINFHQFVKEYQEAIRDDFEKIYAIARTQSKVSPQQFEKFCRDIEADIADAPQEIRELFHDDYIAAVYTVREYAFDSSILQQILLRQLQKRNIEIRYGAEVLSVREHTERGVEVVLSSNESLFASEVFNCTYSQINTLLQQSELPPLLFQHEITEVALVAVPESLQKIGVTIMDGPFFSIMPFPAENLHSLTHVRYTPHFSWHDDGSDVNRSPYQELASYTKESNFPYMIRDVQRYMPMLADLEHQKSLFEIKTVLQENDSDDGRPILFRPNHGMPGFSVIMGGKIDNIYDIVIALKNLKKYIKKKTVF